MGQARLESTCWMRQVMESLRLRLGADWVRDMCYIFVEAAPTGFEPVPSVCDNCAHPLELRRPK